VLAWCTSWRSRLSHRDRQHPLFRGVSGNTPVSLIQRIFHLAFNLGNLAIIGELVVINGVTHAISWGSPANQAGLKRLVAAYRIGHPDLHCTIE
jgi:hypothetical protein